MRLTKLILIVFLAKGSDAQPLNNPDHKKIDSLKGILTNTKNDTAVVRLRLLIGKAAKINRVSFWDSLLKDSKKHKLALYEIRSLRSLALALYNSSDRPKAITFLNEALGLAEKNNYKSEAIAIISEIVEKGYSGRDRKAVLDLLYKGLKMAEEQGDKKSMIDFYSGIATHYFLSEDIDNALKMHLNCLKIGKEIDYRFGIAIALVDIGSDYHALKQEEKAIAYYLESARYAGDLGETIDAAYIYNSVGSAYEIMGNGDSAYIYSFKAYKIAESLNHKYAMTASMVVMAKAIFEKGDIKGSLKMALEALELCKSIGFAAQIPDLALFITKINTRLGDYKGALEAHQLYVRVRDSVSNEKTRKEALEKEFAYNFEKKTSENKLLAQKNQIQELELSQNKYLMIGLGGLSIVILLVALLFIRQNKLKSEQKGVQLEQKLLRAQMNPHFIFNSLNAIKQFIMSGQNGQAELYLSKFSKLMRDLLESNIKENITVKEEAEMITGYIEMESLRFGKSFSYLVKIDHKISAEQMAIPHMMVQPFVENAIWHGLLSKDNDRNLDVIFEADTNHTVRCIVEDNGIGREASMKKETTFKKRSLALSLVKQRLGLLKETLKVDCGVKTIDKIDNRGLGLGTKIIIVLPIIK